MVAGGCFAMGGLILFTAQNFLGLVIGEIFIGIAMGMESLTSPMYVSEVAKPSLRGMLVSSYALMVVCGQFFAGICDGIFSNFHGGWRLMLGFTALPGTIMFLDTFSCQSLHVGSCLPIKWNWPRVSWI
jgi:MFS family permease